MNSNADAKAYSSPEIKTSENIVQNLPLKLLVPMDLSVRLEVNETEINELAESIKIHGVLEPLIVRPSRMKEGKFEIVCGMRRFIAAQKAGLTAVPCVVKERSDREAMEAMLVENMEREDLSDYEVGRWLKLLIEKFPDAYENMTAFAERFGYKSHATVSQLISHYEYLEEFIKKTPTMFVTRVTNIPERVVREIRQASPRVQAVAVEAYLKSMDEGKPLSAREVHSIVDSLTLKVKDEVAAEKKPHVEPLAPSAPEHSAPPQPPTVSKPKEAFEKPSVPEVSGEGVSDEELRKMFEEERRKLEEAKRQAEAVKKAKARLDKAGQLYLMLLRYYDEELVEKFSNHVNLNDISEDKALEYMRVITSVMRERLAEYAENIRLNMPDAEVPGDVLADIIETAKRWL